MDIVSIDTWPLGFITFITKILPSLATLWYFNETKESLYTGFQFRPSFFLLIPICRISENLSESRDIMRSLGASANLFMNRKKVHILNRLLVTELQLFSLNYRILRVRVFCKHYLYYRNSQNFTKAVWVQNISTIWLFENSIHKMSNFINRSVHKKKHR